MSRRDTESLQPPRFATRRHPSRNPVEVQVLSSAYPKQAHGVGNPCANEHQEPLGRLRRSASKALSSEDRAISRPTSTSEKSSAVAIPSAP